MSSATGKDLETSSTIVMINAIATHVEIIVLLMGIPKM